MTGGLEVHHTKGMPQGGPLSPLLSNIILDELDKELERRGLHFCRYADDCNIYVGSCKAGQRVLASITKFIEHKLKLRVNRQKSGVYKSDDTSYLGHTIMGQGKIRISDKALKRFKNKVRLITKRNRGVSLLQIVKSLNDLITGAGSYYKLANSWLKETQIIDGWIRRRLRCYILKQKARTFTIVSYLRRLGGKEHEVWNTVMYAQGWWNLSRKKVVQTVMGKTWFAHLGLRSLHNRLIKT